MLVWGIKMYCFSFQAIATIGERRRKEAQEKMEREIELSKVSIRKEDVELMVSFTLVTIVYDIHIVPKSRVLD